MVRALSMKPIQPKAAGLTEGEDASTSFTKTVAHVEAVKNALSETAQQDVKYAEHFDRAVDGYGSAKEAAIDLGVAESYLSYMRDGKKPAAVRHLMQLLEDSKAAWLAFSSPINAKHDLEQPQPKTKLTRADLLEFALRYLLGSGPLLKSFAREVSEQSGMEPDDVLIALGSK